MSVTKLARPLLKSTALLTLLNLSGDTTMSMMRQASQAARMALTYITVGALTIVWTGIWAYYLYTHGSQNENSYYWCSGFLFSGITILAIGILLGRIGRSARHAETPIGEITSETATIQQDPQPDPRNNQPAQAPVMAAPQPSVPVATLVPPAAQPRR